MEKMKNMIPGLAILELFVFRGAYLRSADGAASGAERSFLQRPAADRTNKFRAEEEGESYIRLRVNVTIPSKVITRVEEVTV